MDTDRQSTPSTGGTSSVYVSLRRAVQPEDIPPGDYPPEISPQIQSEDDFPDIRLVVVVSSSNVLFHIAVVLTLFIVLPILMLCVIWLVRGLLYQLLSVFLSIGIFLCLCKIGKAAAKAAKIAAAPHHAC